MSMKQKILQDKRKKRIQKIREQDTNTTDIDDLDDKPTLNLDEKPKDHIEESMKVSVKLWDDIKQRVKTDDKFVDMPDGEKLKIYQDSDFKQFYNEYPIVCRYMICMGQFSHKAFKRFLIKCKNVKHDPIKSREKGYHDDQWVSRQADYVRYLWEAYQKQHYSPSEAQNIWLHAYKTLNKEFQDFKDLHKEVEEKIKTDAKSNKTELVKELLKRLSTQEQKLDTESTGGLIQKLKDKVLDQRKKKLIESINTDVKKIAPTRECRGSLKEVKPSS
jgi:hypothetical protein